LKKGGKKKRKQTRKERRKGKKINRTEEGHRKKEKIKMAFNGKTHRR
jgi:hypothetical protein